MFGEHVQGEIGTNPFMFESLLRLTHVHGNWLREGARHAWGNITRGNWEQQQTPFIAKDPLRPFKTFSVKDP